jgi:protein SCO1
VPEPDPRTRTSRRERLVIALFVAVASRESNVERPAVDGPPSTFSGSIMPKGVRAPRFALRDEDGRALRSEDLRGRPVIVTFLYTQCKDTCPIEAQQIRGALDQLSDTDQEVPAIAVAVDPPRDTPTSARRFLAEQRVYGRIRFALGSREELEPVWRRFFIQEQKPDAEHQARVTLIDSRGFQRVGYPVNQLTPDGVAKDVRILLAEDARRGD